jgi:hypothetical protein
LNHLSESLINFTTNFNKNSKPIDTYLFQNISTTQYPNNNNNHLNETTVLNSNCYPCNLQQQSHWTGIRREGPCFQPNSRTVPTSGVFMDCSGKGDTSASLCFPTPVVYTPEMDTLFSSGGIIYARKSGRNKIVEIKMKFL